MQTETHLDRTRRNTCAGRGMGNQQSTKSRRQIQQQTCMDGGNRVCTAVRADSVGTGGTETHRSQPAFTAGQTMTAEAVR